MRDVSPSTGSNPANRPYFRSMTKRFALAALLLALPARAATSEDFAKVVQEALPGIVNITVWSDKPLDGVAASELGTEHRSAIAGSGVVVDPSGLIVTSRHLVEGVSTIAILKVEVNKPLTALKFGDSDQLRVGQPVICIGNPFGIGLTVSSGVVSALNRDIHKTPFDDFIQSDCAINPGNSGGPMMNSAGEVIGIDTANIDPYGKGSIGLGFALTSNDVAFVVPRLIGMGKVNAGWLGLSLQDVTPEIARALALPGDRGFIVTSVDPGGPSDRAGFAEGDVVLDVAGHGQQLLAVHLQLEQRIEAGIARHRDLELAGDDRHGNRIRAVAVDHARNLALGAQTTS